MDFLEKDLEDIICEAEINELKERGLSINGRIHRQLIIGHYGISDIVTFSRGLFVEDHKYRESSLVTVYELKKDTVDKSTFLQAIRYVKGIDRYLKNRGVSFGYYFNIVLIGKKISNDDMIYLTDLLTDEYGGRFVEYYTYSYSFKGIEFKQEQGYKLTNEGF